MQEARSKFDVETDPADVINMEPINGEFSPDGSASVHFRRNSASPVMGRINCKVLLCVCNFLNYVLSFTKKNQIC